MSNLSTHLSRIGFLALLLLSGFCGISYEILYARVLGNLIGDQFAISASILLSFLLGIGFGTLFAHRLWRFLWLVEAGIGLCGVTFALGAGILETWLYSGSNLWGEGLGRSLLACVILLSLPSLLIGCSLPLFAGYLSRLSSGHVFAKAYTIYNFGAAATTLLIEFWLLRILGLRNTLLSIAAVNFLVSISLLAGFGDLRATRPASSERARFPARHRAALGMAGVASAVFQLLMIKLAECFLGPFRETFSLVLCVVLLGVAFGSYVTEKFRLGFEHVLAANLVGLAWLLGGFGLVTRIYATYAPVAAQSSLLSVLFKFSAVTLLMGLPATSFGATIPALLPRGHEVARESGRLLFICSMGNAVGFLLMAFVLHKTFDYGVLILIIAGLSGASLMIYLKGGGPRAGLKSPCGLSHTPSPGLLPSRPVELMALNRKGFGGYRPPLQPIFSPLQGGIQGGLSPRPFRGETSEPRGARSGRELFSRTLGIPAMLALLLATFGVQHTLWDENLLYLGYTAFASARELKEARAEMIVPERFKGHQDVFSINRTREESYFFINGEISIPLNTPPEKVVGAFSALFAPRTDRALVLGVGSGSTAGTVTLLFDRTDAVEINPVVLENLHRMADDNFNIQSRPQVNLILDDAIHFTKVSREQYSLILNTVMSPLYFSSAKLYTRDFLERVRQRLKPDGIYVTWFDTQIGDHGADIILKTVSQSFKECWIGCIKSGYFLLICSQQSIQLRQPQLITDNAVLSHYLFNQHALRPDWLPYGLLSTRAFDLIKDPSVPINTLDRPALEFEITRLGERSMEGFFARLKERMSVVDVARPLQRVLTFQPLDLVLYVDELLGNSEITDQWKRLVSQEVSGFDQAYNRAKLQYYAAYASSAGTADAHHMYGLTLLKQGYYPEALKEFRRALEINPKRNNTYFNIGSCYERMEQFELALQNYAKELEVDPDDPDVFARIGRAYYKVKRFREALACLDRALLKSEKGTTYLYRGLALEALGSPGEAEISYLKALNLEPENEDAFLALARVTVSGP